MLASTVQFSRNGQHHKPPPSQVTAHGLQPEKTRLNARFLRTQQRAHPGPAPPPPFRAPEGTY